MRQRATRAWAICMLILAAQAAQGDERLLGTWIGTGEENKGTRVVVEANAVILDGERMPLRFVGPGRLEIGPIGDADPLRYELRGDDLVTVDEDGRATWRRQKAAPDPGKAPLDKPIGSHGGKQPATRSGTVVMVQHALKDPGSQNMVSHTLLAPKGWTVRGGAWWSNQTYFNVMPSRDIRISAPDGREIRLAPSIVARDIQPPAQLNMPRPQEGSADKGIPVLYMPQDLEAWKRWIEARAIRESYPEATNVSVTNAVVVPELTALLNKQIEWRRQLMAQQAQADANIGMRQFIDAKVYAFECRYTDNGHDWEELILFGTTYQGIESQLIGTTITWDLNPVVSYRAHAGQLEASMPLMVSVVNTASETHQWSKMRADLQAKLAGIARKGAIAANKAAMERSRIMSRASREINDIIVGGYKKRTAIRDATHRKVINSIQETEDYAVPGGTTSVQLPSHYPHVYTNGNGEYLLTDDALYDPNTDSNLNGSQWTGMQPQR